MPSYLRRKQWEADILALAIAREMAQVLSVMLGGKGSFSGRSQQTSKVSTSDFLQAIQKTPV